MFSMSRIPGPAIPYPTSQHVVAIGQRRRAYRDRGYTPHSKCSKCFKDKGQAHWFHHMCYSAFYKDMQKKEVLDEETCNRCPLCQAPKLTPKLKRKERKA